MTLWDKNGANARKQEEMGGKERPGTQRSRGMHYEVFPIENWKDHVNDCFAEMTQNV